MKRTAFSIVYLALIVFVPLRAFSASLGQPHDFIDKSLLENDFKAFCLKTPTSNSAPKTTLIDFTSRQSRGLRFESVRFEMSSNGFKGHPDCRAEREIIQLVGADGKRAILLDSGFYPEPYCGNPVQFSQPPTVYEMESAGTSNERKRKVIVIESVSSTLPCPDTNEVRFRRFLVFDINSLKTPLFDVQADFIVPEHGNSPYRLHLINAKNVLHSAFPTSSGKKPSHIELNDGEFSLGLASTEDKASTLKPPTEKLAGNRVVLNSIYSKDQRHVYYETVDESDQIKGADPSTFQLLNPDGESAYTKDAKRVYFFGKTIASADAKTFVQMNERYGKDLNHVYHMDSILENADVASFTAPFKSVWYAKDKNHVFSGTKIFAIADPDTFVTGDDRSCGEGCTYRSEDKNYRFGEDGRVVQKVVSPR